MTPLTFYEQVGILIPGAVLLFAVTLLQPEWKAILGGNGLTIGGLGLFLLLSYAAGHAVAAVGNIIEKLLWAVFGGLPTDRLARNPEKVLGQKRLARFKELFQKRYQYDAPISELEPDGPPKRWTKLWWSRRKAWRSAFGQLYSDVRVNNPGTVLTFNGNYGLNRGLAASMMVITLLICTLRPQGFVQTAVAAGLLTIVFLFRTYRFGIYFAREVFNNFLNLEFAKVTNTESAKDGTPSK
ncbi:MAG: hypothetical protein ACJ796_10435 [Gemmatimonadaceae bacterium]